MKNKILSSYSKNKENKTANVWSPFYCKKNQNDITPNFLLEYKFTLIQ
jgi:hypothetical protein